MSSSACRSPSRRSSATPNTALMITSRVIDCIAGWRGKGSPTGQRAISRSVTSSIVRSYARIRSPWKGGSISLRRARCSVPSSRSRDLSPSSGFRTMLRPAAMVLTRSAEKRALIDGGSETKTAVPIGRIRRVNVPPSSRRHRSISGTGRAMNRAVWSAAGREGSGGSAMQSNLLRNDRKKANSACREWTRVAAHGGRTQGTEAPLLGQGARGLRGRRRADHGRFGPDLGLRRDPADPDPRQGEGPQQDVALLVRADRRHRPQPLHLSRRPGRGRGPRHASAEARDVPGRVRRARLHHRVGLEGVPGDRRGLRDELPA